ncbi:MAG: agmatine deiminase family protein [Chloroflexi bacterium]|nr:agmatine deiminase family protein [Chloroflexota bacterium]
MNKALSIIILTIMSGLLIACSNADVEESANEVITETKEEIPVNSDEVSLVEDTEEIITDIRVPAEWELHDATWMQWPTKWEANMRPAFADIINVIQAYEPVHLLTSSESEKTEAEEFLSEQGVPDTNITWHIVPIDNSWMRDNGPIYVTDGSDIWIQNWKFDAWGGNFGSDIPYENDNQIPAYVGNYLDMDIEDHQDYVLEKGNLEANGEGILVLGWDCQDDRNPGMTREEHEKILKEAFGATKVLWVDGHWEGEGTTGHIDATARFVDTNTLVIADYEAPIDFDGLAAEAKKTGLNVVRYYGDLNWLVGNGFIVGMSEGDEKYDEESKAQLEEFFPDRDVYLLNVDTVAEAGGGIHCVTNDQPALE